MKRLAVVLCAAMAIACGQGEAGHPGGTGGASCAGSECPPPPDACPEGFTELSDVGCEPILPESDCPPGTRPVIGSSTCQPVGWTDCPTGFVPDPSGWGCAEVVATSACTGATREAVGESACQPIGDCGAAFPPPGASFFVRADYTDAELDATHFRKIGEALAAAPSGAVIAVDSGVYVEGLSITKPVTLFGRCAEKVTIEGAGDNVEGIVILGVRGVAVRGVTLEGHFIGVRVTDGALDLADSLLTGNRWVGIGVVGAGSVVQIDGSVVRSTVPDSAGDPTHGVLVAPGTRVDLSRSALVDNAYASLVLDGHDAVATMTDTVVRDGHTQTVGSVAGKGGYGIVVANGAAVDVDRSVFLHNQGAAIGVTGSYGDIPSSAHVARTVIRDMLYDDFGAARGLEAADGARLTVEDSAVVLCPETQIIATHPSTVLHAERVVFRGPIPAGDVDSGLGVISSDQARVELVSAAVISNRAAGLFVQHDAELVVDSSVVRDGLPALAPGTIGSHLFGIGAAVLPGARLELTSSALSNNRAMGIFVRGSGASATLTGTLVDGTAPDEDGLYGRGINVQVGARLEVTGSAILRSHDTGVIAFGSDATLTDSLISRTERGTEPPLAIDVVAALAARLEVTRTTLSASPDIGLVVSGSSAYVTGSFLSKNAIAVHVQDGSTLLEQDEPSPDPLVVVVSPDTRFLGNETRVGAGSVAVPTPVGP